MNSVRTPPSDEEQRLQVASSVAEMRAHELRAALRNALNGAPHWRLVARRLLQQIDNGVVR